MGPDSARQGPDKWLCVCLVLMTAPVLSSLSLMVLLVEPRSLPVLCPSGLVEEQPPMSRNGTAPCHVTLSQDIVTWH